MTAVDFVELLADRRLVPESIASQLRDKVSGDRRLTPESILKYLVKKELVTRNQASQLLDELMEVDQAAESSILGLTPLAELEETLSNLAPKAPATGAAETSARGALRSKRSEPLADEPILLSPIGDLGGEGQDLFQSARPPSESPGAAFAPTLKLSGKGKAKGGKKSKRRGNDAEASKWDTPLILYGGGGLAVLLLSGVVLYWLLVHESADAVLTKANQLFESGSYTQSIETYQEFVTGWPSHQQHSEAKVRMELAKLWRATEQSNNYPAALEAALAVIPEIENEPAFIATEEDAGGISEARQELSSLLTTIAKGLAEQAESAEDPAAAAERLKQLDTALELTENEKYVPERVRVTSELEAIGQTRDRVEKRLRREGDLTAALAQMEADIAKGDTAAALLVRKELIKQHPTLIDSEPLGQKIEAITAAERSLVKFVEERKAPLLEPATTKVLAELALAERRGKPIDAQGVVTVFVDGGLYGLNMADGALLWRRFVGLGSNAIPLQLDNGTIVAVDAARSELVCLNAETGKLVWRLPLEGRLVTPTLVGERLLVPSDAGKLYVIQSTGGELLGHITFTQPVRVPVAANDRGDRLYVLGSHSNLYTLSGADFSCLGVHYLGHAEGAIEAPPLSVLNKVIVTENSGMETCRVRALSTDKDGVAGDELASHRLSGLITTPLARSARRVAAVTSLGQVAVFDVSDDNDTSSLTLLAGREAQDGEQLAQFAALHDGRLWIAGRQLSKLSVLPTGNQMPLESLERDYRGDAFDYPLQVIGDAIVHVRRPAGQPGACVAATVAGDGTAGWEIDLAVPPAGSAAVDASELRITAGAASGAVYLVDREAMTRRVQDRAERLSVPSASPSIYTNSLTLAEGRMVLGGVGHAQLIHYRPDDPRQAIRAIQLTGPLSCPTVAWLDGFASATDVGQVTLHDAEQGAPMGTGFQPELTPGREFHWLEPAVIGAGADSQLVISDGGDALYLLSLKQQPQPHLATVSTGDVGGSPLVTRLAVAGDRVFAGSEAGPLAMYSLPALKAEAAVDVGGGVSWGPFATERGVVLATEADELLLVGPDGSTLWRQPLKRGDVGGAPLVDQGAVYLLYPGHGIARLNLADGVETGFVELGQPAIAGPIAFGPRLVVSAPDGTLLIVNKP